MASAAEIARFTVESFRSFERASIGFHPLTMLIGPNASGKSNFIEALRLISWLARGQWLDGFEEAVASGELAIRGAAQDLTLNGSDVFRLECRFDLNDEWISADTLRVAIRVQGSEPRIWEELLGYEIQGRPLYSTQAHGDVSEHDIQVVYDTLRDQGTVPCTDRQLVLTQLRTPAAFGAMDSRAGCIPRVASAYTKALSRIVFLDPEPRVMRGYVRHPAQPLSRNGANLSGVLFGLCESADCRAALLEFIRHLPEQDIRGIDFVRTDSDDVRVRLVEAFGGREQLREAPLLSDGTLRVLAVAAAVLSAPEHSLVVIEEIDNGVHPSRARALLENIQRVAKARGLRVLLTSHNPALLDALPDEAIPHVACCFRDPTDGTSRLVHLEDFERYPELLAQGTLGHLMTKGIIERYLKERRSEAQLKQDALRWLQAQRGSGT